MLADEHDADLAGKRVLIGGAARHADRNRSTPRGRFV
jgi:hypothetical protein